jgi:hypothetical protein
MVREFANLGTEVFPHFSEIRNFPDIFMVIGHGNPLSLLVILHSSMPEDISGIFRRFPAQK